MFGALMTAHVAVVIDVLRVRHRFFVFALANEVMNRGERHAGERKDAAALVDAHVRERIDLRDLRRERGLRGRLRLL